jgi:hypothetical protein
VSIANDRARQRAHRLFDSALKDDTKVLLLKQIKKTLPDAAFIKNTRSDLALRLALDIIAGAAYSKATFRAGSCLSTLPQSL